MAAATAEAAADAAGHHTFLTFARYPIPAILPFTGSTIGGSRSSAMPTDTAMAAIGCGGARSTRAVPTGGTATMRAATATIDLGGVYRGHVDCNCLAPML